MPSAGRPGRLAIVVASAVDPHRWATALADYRPEVMTGFAEVERLCTRDIVIVDLPRLDGEAIEQIRAAAPRCKALKVLTADHGELRAILREGLHSYFVHVVPRGGRGENVRTLVGALRQHADGEAPTPEGITRSTRVSERRAGLEILRATISKAAGVPGAIIRPYQPSPNKFELQLVLRLGAAFEEFHCGLPPVWRWPVRARSGDLFSHVTRGHPSVRNLGDIVQDQEIYVLPFAGTLHSAYVAILPWRDDDRVTVTAGVWAEECDELTRATYAALMADAYQGAAREVVEFSIPKLQEGEKGVRYLAEYNWVIAGSHVGPDRRREDTSFVNRYMFVGKRETVAKEVARRAGGFSDRVPRWAMCCFLVYASLSLVDTVLTSHFVGAGRAVELNPVLSPVVAEPWALFLAKTAFAVLSFAIVARFHLFERLRLGVVVVVAFYVLLDGYWLVLVWFGKV